MDAIELLKHDHRMVGQLFRDYQAAGGPPGGDEQRRGVVEMIQTAPTRPHPAAPDEPPSLASAAPVAAIYDRLRDRLQGRPQT
ncbi:MAG TPA: hypothetical protein VFJ14_11135 [Nocardioidaceae bacterium]|nr:hypothetical protein [Nocardioidaceae bacterium]